MRSRLETVWGTLVVVAFVAVTSITTTANARTPLDAPESLQSAAAPPAMAPAQKKRRKPRPKVEQGVPKGVQNCIDALIKMAEKDPLIEYEGRPQEIVKGGLLWNDPQSKCYAGDDLDLRKKIFDMAKAWRMKEADKVRSLLQEIKSSAPQS